MLAVTVAVKALSAAWDAFNVTVEEQQEKISNLSSEIETLQQEYETLSEKQALTGVEKERLEYLERRLELDKEILEAETRNLYNEQRGNKWNPTDWADKDSNVVKSAKEFGDFRGGWYNFSALKDGYEVTTSKAEYYLSVLDNLKESYEYLSSEQDKYEKGSLGYSQIHSELESNINNQAKQMEKLEKSYDTLTEKQGEYLIEVEKYKEQIDSGLLSGDDLKEAEEIYNQWNNAYETVKALSVKVGQAIGKFDEYGNKVEEVKEEIVEINGNLDISGDFGSLETYQSTLESITKSYSALQTVQSEQNSQNYITKESYDALIEANSDFANCLEYGNGHMQINTEKANAMAKANSELALAELEVKEALEVEQYNKNVQAINDLIASKDIITQETQEQIDALQSENAQIEANVQQYDLIESQIKQATSAYNEWQAAMNAPEEGDMYDSIVSNLDKVKELYDQGLTGTNAFKTAATALFGEDFNLDNFGTYFENIKRYFSEGSQGAQNFVDDLVKIGQLQIDNDGNYFGNVDWDKVQKELNLTYDDLQAIFGKLHDFDFNIDTTNGVDGIENLTEAQNNLNSAIDDYRKKIDSKKKAGLDTTQEEEKLKALETQLESVNKKLENTATEAENVSNTTIKLDIDAELGKLDLTNLSAEAQETLNQLNATNAQIKLNAQIGADTTFLEQQAQNQLSLLKEQLKVPVETDTKNSEKSISDLGSTANVTNGMLKNVFTSLLNIGRTNVGTAGLPMLITQLKNAITKAGNLKDTLSSMPSVNSGDGNTGKSGKSKSGKNDLNGTTGGFAHANGTAFINGSDISAKESSWALTGELGRELVVFFSCHLA